MKHEELSGEEAFLLGSGPGREVADDDVENLIGFA
jgi:hypothetical protein